MTLSMDKLPNPKGKKPEDVISRQDLFLESFKSAGSVRASVSNIGMGRRQIYNWLSDDLYGFREKFELAKHEFRELLQDLAVNRVIEQKVSDNPTLLIALLNAHWPEKYRPQTSDIDETAKATMDEMRKSFKSINDKDNVIDVEVSPEEEVEKLLEDKKGK